MRLGNFSTSHWSTGGRRGHAAYVTLRNPRAESEVERELPRGFVGEVLRFAVETRKRFTAFGKMDMGILNKLWDVALHVFLKAYASARTGAIQY
jgi:hypothetical protein